MTDSRGVRPAESRCRTQGSCAGRSGTNGVSGGFSGSVSLGRLIVALGSRGRTGARYGVTVAIVARSVRELMTLPGAERTIPAAVGVAAPTVPAPTLGTVAAGFGL